MPAVCSAIGSNKFLEFADVTPIKRIGPANGANVYFTFSLQPCRGPQPAMVESSDPVRPTRSEALPILDLKGAVALVSCVKSKLPRCAAARALYTSAWFRKVRDIVEASGARWFVLSSRYGLVAPDVEIAPYDYTLNDLGVAERQQWAARVLDKLLPEMTSEKRVVMFAGHRYREFLVEPLWRAGIEVQVPMAHLTRGAQLAWLSEH
jgi:hypothetical protein